MQKKLKSDFFIINIRTDNRIKRTNKNESFEDKTLNKIKIYDYLAKNESITIVINALSYFV